MRELSGTDGELIERLMSVVDHDPHGDQFWWLDVSGLVAHAIGGCADIVPESNRHNADGSISWEHQGSREVVARVIWMNRLRLRLAALVGDGMAEDFLVTSLRDHIDRELRGAGARPVGQDARTRYDEWIAQQATGGDNLEISLVARALMAPASGVQLAEAPVTGRLAVWGAASTAVDAAAVAAWRAARATAPV